MSSMAFATAIESFLAVARESVAAWTVQTVSAAVSSASCAIAVNEARTMKRTERRRTDPTEEFVFAMRRAPLGINGS
jgi:hypothetical protein